MVSQLNLPLHNMSLFKQVISFLFDIFLGPSYNQSPPSVKYMTVRYYFYLLALITNTFQTNGGKFRFNPNLYAVDMAYILPLRFFRSTSFLGWQSLSVSSWYMARPWMGIGEVYVIASMFSPFDIDGPF